MKTVVYTCDICKTSKSESDLSRISANTRGITINMNKHHPSVEYDICKDYLKKKGFVVEPPTDENRGEVIKQNTNAFEKKFIDLLADLGVVFHA